MMTSIVQLGERDWRTLREVVSLPPWRRAVARAPLLPATTP